MEVCLSTEFPWDRQGVRPPVIGARMETVLGNEAREAGQESRARGIHQRPAFW